MPVFSKDKKDSAEENDMIEKMETEPRIEPALTRALHSIIKTIDLFRDTAQDVWDGDRNVDVSAAELKDLVARCKGYSLIVEKEFKMLRRRMQVQVKK